MKNEKNGKWKKQLNIGNNYRKIRLVFRPIRFQIIIFLLNKYPLVLNEDIFFVLNEKHLIWARNIRSTKFKR